MNRTAIDASVVEYFKCPDIFGTSNSEDQGAGSRPEHSFEDRDIEACVRLAESYPGTVRDFDALVRALRYEQYLPEAERQCNRDLIGRIYYWLRPALPVSVRKHLQAMRLRGRLKLSFPRWPVDCTVDRLMEVRLIAAMRSAGIEEIPFIWFWPEGYSSCAILTHDVETGAGLSYCSVLMDINDGYGIKSSFQLVPEERYPVTAEVLQQIRSRGYEINVHDLNHDGHLFSDWETFSKRVLLINRYAKEYAASGFRAGVLYRNADWYSALEVDYDMSLPNVGHLDPQRGGCCTVMPFYIGNILELPVTTIQDYSLFHILGDYSIQLWRTQIGLIRKQHGLATFIVHPDYIAETRARATYRMLLEHLVNLRSEEGLWIPLPADINRWWRARSEMRLVRRGGGWELEGADKERASIAYATCVGDKLSFTYDRVLV